MVMWWTIYAFRSLVNGNTVYHLRDFTPRQMPMVCSTPPGLAYHQRLSQNKYMMVECDITIYHKAKSREKAHQWRLSQNKYIMVECDITIYHKTKSRGKAYHQRLSQNKYTIVECDTAIYRETKSRAEGTPWAVITEQIHHG